MKDTESLAATAASPAIPAHVPAELVKSFAPPMFSGGCPFDAVSKLHGEAPIFWNPINQFGGAWTPTRAEDIRFILGRPDLFTNKGEAGFSKLLGEEWDLVPLELDPPEHTVYRSFLNTLLSPSVVNGLTPGITARAIELIEVVREAGECEFMGAFGRPFPVGIFMQLMGLPAQLTDRFLSWEFDLLHDPDFGKKMVAAREIRDYLLELAAERRERPTGDLTSSVVAARVDGMPFSDDKVKGMLFLLFVGGLDTVASSLGFFFRYLAEHPAQQDRLRHNSALIDQAVEELLRRFSVVTVNRQCKTDLEIRGVQMKAGDWITLHTSLGSLDPQEFSSPREVNFERKNVRHFGLSYGPHFCAGSHLARRELRIALREWLARIPPWRIKNADSVVARAGGVLGVEHMVLAWD
jgi:cytochrome P450